MSVTAQRQVCVCGHGQRWHTCLLWITSATEQVHAEDACQQCACRTFEQRAGRARKER